MQSIQLQGQHFNRLIKKILRNKICCTDHQSVQQTIHRITTINLNQSKLDQYLHIKSDKSMKLPQEEWDSGVAATRLIVISAVILIHGIAVFHPDEIWLVTLNQKENLSAWIIGAFKTIFSPF